MGNPVNIIRVGPLFFFTTPLPPGSVFTFRTHRDVISNEVISLGKDAGCFALYVSFINAPQLLDGETTEQYEARAAEAIRQPVRDVWRGLHDRGVVDDPQMPEWIQGDPMTMMPAGDPFKHHRAFR